MRKVLALLLIIFMIIPFSVSAEEVFVTDVVLCANEDVYAADYVFKVVGDASDLRIKTYDTSCLFEWNYIKNEARLYISFASASPLKRCKTLAEVVSDADISIVPVSVVIDGKKSDLSYLSHIGTAMSDKTPTCDSPGRTGGTFCTRCGITLTEPTILPATGPNISALLSKDGVLTIQGAVSDSETAEGISVVAIYNDKTLMELLDISAQKQNDIKMSIGNMSDASTVKLFRWRSLSSMNPDHDSVTVNVIK